MHYTFFLNIFAKLLAPLTTTVMPVAEKPWHFIGQEDRKIFELLVVFTYISNTEVSTAVLPAQQTDLSAKGDIFRTKVKR